MRYESINRPLTLGGHVKLKSYFTGSSAWLHSTCGQILEKVLLSLISHTSLTVEMIKSVLRLYLTAVVLTTAKKSKTNVCLPMEVEKCYGACFMVSGFVCLFSCLIMKQNFQNKPLYFRDSAYIVAVAVKFISLRSRSHQ